MNTPIRGLAEKLGLTSNDGDVFADVRSPKTQMALALGRTKRPEQIYGGTVPYEEKQRRRARNRRAGQSRRASRRSR